MTLLTEGARQSSNPLLDDSDTICPCHALSELLEITKKSESPQPSAHPTHLGNWAIDSRRLSIIRLIMPLSPLDG